MANHLTSDKQIDVIHHLAEGNSIRATSRLCRVHRNTVMRHLVEFGASCQHFMDLSFANLHLSHLQIDEIWTFVGKKQGTLTDSEKNDPDTEFGDAYLFIGLDEETKLIPGYVLGKRNRENAEKLANMLADRLVRRPGGQDEISISTDGFPAAIGSAFGPTARHGVLLKNYANPESGRHVCFNRHNRCGELTIANLGAGSVDACGISFPERGLPSSR